MFVASFPSITSAMFSCEKMGMQRGGVPLYANVGVCLREGAVLIISAPNGCGKTTFLKQCAGLIPTHEGSIEWFGRRITSPRMYDGDMLYVGDTNGLYPELTVAEQLAYFASAFGEKMRLPAAIRYLALEPYQETRIAQLSAGWKRRVALARLLIIPALLWLLDEPFVHLDTHACGLVAGMIHSHAERGGVTLMTMPHMEGAVPRLPHTPVSVLHLADFSLTHL
jgi:heme exporter protein A